MPTKQPHVPSTKVRLDIPDIGKPDPQKPNLSLNNLEFVTLQCKRVDNGYVMVYQGIIKTGVGAGQIAGKESVYLYKQDLYNDIGDILDNIEEEKPALKVTSPDPNEPTI